MSTVILEGSKNPIESKSDVTPLSTLHTSLSELSSQF